MPALKEIERSLNHLFQIEKYGKDSSFSRFIPATYDQIQFPWKQFFEANFVEQFNGLMIRGAENVNTVFLAVFPTDDVLEKFISQSMTGDLLFMHHPLVMECGDPLGKSGRGFVPIPSKYLYAIKEKQLSIYTCHGPMDFHQTYGTSISIAKALQANVIDGFAQGGPEQEAVGLICEIDETSTEKLQKHLKKLFNIPYTDFEGKQHDSITKIAIIAGCGDVVSLMKEAEEKGAEAYITGEIHCHIDNEYGKYKYSLIMDYVKETNMSLIGVSHSASEYLVKKTLMHGWFKEIFDVNITLLPQEKWWL
ncbi:MULTISPECIES: Nif3-like dinuclear metal center hexameric protein [Bacillus]|uniref:Nif3-like dinuclear metal center hexameric protein n=1 Tax=Bacillus TaxID=1386 RepID=UPI00046A7582|nr:MULTISPECIES: Nif3-like dinuclear metal center hexameric protein [Bacillus]MED1411857.1 Nif3-like dinuclear metal center hexameric protein [Bacillus paramycoides]MED1465346.1 Nif3-like dinuclear metal center hexameric protein [Bacillus paramycoides]MED1490993.1 Nif3-like dinuclear metal center hexameric protein [Bacillus paramycoides]